jgi:hypothetical protein
MSISEHFQYRNDVFQSDIFVSDIGISDVDVGCRISPTLGSMSMPTYESDPKNDSAAVVSTVYCSVAPSLRLLAGREIPIIFSS